MKKRILILAVGLMILCFVFVVHKVIDAGTTDADPTDVSTTRIKAPLRDITFDHGDNFSEDDINLVRFLHDKDCEIAGEPGMRNFGDFLDSTYKSTFYKVKVDLKSKPYFISVYKPNNDTPVMFSLEYGGECDYLLKWYKFYDYDSIPETIDDYILIGSYAVYDCVIESDAKTGESVNRQCKYFVALTQGYSLDNNDYLYGLYDTVLYRDNSSFANYDWLVIMHRFYHSQTSRFNLRNIYQYHTDENGDEYILFSRKTTNELTFDDFKSFFGNKYEEMLPYLKRFEDADEYHVIDGVEHSIKKIGLKLEDLFGVFWIGK